MAINRVAILKKCRSIGLDAVHIGIDKKSIRHLKKRNKKTSEYGLQLREKQKAKFIYGILEKSFHNYYIKADKQSGQTGVNLMIILERRLDNVIFRMGFARTRQEAKQIISHKHVNVNGKRNNFSSYLVKVNDIIEIDKKYKTCKRYKDILKITGDRIIISWLNVDKKKLYGVIKRLPSRKEIDTPINEMLIIELYSK